MHILPLYYRHPKTSFCGYACCIHAEIYSILSQLKIYRTRVVIHRLRFMHQRKKNINSNIIMVAREKFPPKRELNFSPVILALLYLSKICITSNKIIIKDTILLYTSILSLPLSFLTSLLLDYFSCWCYPNSEQL